MLRLAVFLLSAALPRSSSINPPASTSTSCGHLRPVQRSAQQRAAPLRIAPQLSDENDHAHLPSATARPHRPAAAAPATRPAAKSKESRNASAAYACTGCNGIPSGVPLHRAASGSVYVTAQRTDGFSSISRPRQQRAQLAQRPAPEPVARPAHRPSYPSGSLLPARIHSRSTPPRQRARRGQQRMMNHRQPQHPRGMHAHITPVQQTATAAVAPPAPRTARLRIDSTPPWH